MKILLVEDDLNLSNDLKHQLAIEQFEVETAYDGHTAERLMARNEYDCIVLDVSIPGKSGFEITKGLRNKAISTPVIIITAYGELEDKLQGFESGADDYITKPFFFKELLARINAIFKRAQNYAEINTSVADLVVNHSKKQVSRNGVLIKLTSREYEIINLLVEANGAPISKKQLLKKVWGANFEANSNTIEVFINMLRNKIDKNFEPKLIKTRIGYGYYLGLD